LASFIVHSFLEDASVKNLIKFNGKSGAQVAELAFPTKDRDVLRGDRSIASYLVRSQTLTSPLYSTDARVSSDIDQWLFGGSTLDVLERHLTLRSFISGYSVTLADVYMWSQIIKTNTSLTDSSKPHTRRWFAHLSTIPQFQAGIKSSGIQTKSDVLLGVSSSASATGRTALDLSSTPSSTPGSTPQVEQKKKQHSKAKYQPLPDAVHGKVVTRFPPEPSGWLHLGHAKAALLNQFYAQEYNGKLIIRFDDTNPAKENDEFVQSIMEDLKTLGITDYDRITYTSSYFDQLEERAEQMIKEGTAYVDKSTKDQIALQRKSLSDSPYRSAKVEESLRLWSEMKKGTAEGQKCALRAKINNQSLNGTMRDPAIYRTVISPPHHRTGSKYKVYPTYDFACPIVDSIEGITHALRSNEYRDRNEQYEWFLKHAPGVNWVKIADYSRLNFEYTLLSKRKLQWFVDQKIVSGWDDPSFPTVRGAMRRGLTVPALKEYIYAQGSSQRGTNQGMEKLWSINKQAIDKVVPRYWAIPEDDLVPMRITNGPESVEYRTIPFHKQNASLGNKVTTYYKNLWVERADANAVKEGDEITLMDWGNCYIRQIVKNDDGKVQEVVGELHLAGDFKTTQFKLTWLPREGADGDYGDLVGVDLVVYNFLVTKGKLEEDDKLEDYVNKDIRKVKKAVGDLNLRLLKKGDRIQLERRGYWICDQALSCPNKRVVLINIPDGKSDGPSHLVSK